MTLKQQDIALLSRENLEKDLQEAEKSHQRLSMDIVARQRMLIHIEGTIAYLKTKLNGGVLKFFKESPERQSKEPEGK